MRNPIFHWLPYLAIAAVYFSGAGLDIMEVDAAQYASISLEMVRSGEYLKVYDRFEDYLDKPPLLFWLSALSFKLFGIGSWQYRLPSILFSFLGIWSTYKLGHRLYDRQVGRYASWILGGSFAMIMINNDVKTDTILVSAIVFSIWMLVSYIRSEKWKYLLGAAVGIAVSMLTKGPIGLVMPALAIGGHVLLKRDWKLIFKWQWAVMLVTVAILLIPMCIGLYEQHGPKGLLFFFWTQSFGRITGESEWTNDASPLYFTHIFLWSFLPWTILGIAGVVSELRNIPKTLGSTKHEVFLISGVVLVWIALSLSRFKLPHYIFVVYPLIAILAAKFITELRSSARWASVQLTVSCLAAVLLATVLVCCFPEGGMWVPALIIVAVAAAVVVFLRASGHLRIALPSFMISIAIGLGLNLHFYPQLLPYQANAVVGKWVKGSGMEDRLIGFATGGRALDFYAGGVVRWMNDAASAIAAIDTGTVVYASQRFRDDLIERGYEPRSEMVFDNFEVQKLTIQFLNPQTRENALKKNYLMFY